MLADRVGEYEARAYVASPGVNEGYDRWTYGTAGTPTTPETDPDPIITAGNVLRSVSARALSSTSVVFTATVSTGTAGTVYWRYRSATSTVWINASATPRAANTPTVSRTVTGLTPATTYLIQASVNADYSNPLPATVTTQAAAPPFSITYFAATGVVQTGVTLRVRTANSQTTPAVTVSIAGRPAQTQLSAEPSFTFTGLTPGTRYTATAAAVDGTRTDQATATFTTEAARSSLRLPEVSRVSVSLVRRSSFSALASFDFGVDEDGRPFSGAEVQVEWQYRQSGASSWVPAGTSSAVFGTASGVFSGLRPLTTYQVRARVNRVQDRAHAGNWITATTRTGKVTQAVINQWIRARTDATTARTSTVAFNASLIDLERNLRDISNHGLAAEQTLRIDTAVRELQSAGALASQTETLVNTAQSQQAKLQTDLTRYQTTITGAVNSVGAAGATVTTSGAGVVIGGVTNVIVGGTLSSGVVAGGSALAVTLTLLGVVGIAVLGVTASLALDALNDRGRTVKNDAGQARREVRAAREALLSSGASYNSLTEQIREINAVIAALQQEIQSN